MAISDSQVKSYFRQKGHEVKALKEEASRLDFSQYDDVCGFIEYLMGEIKEEIPDEIEAKPVALKYYRCAIKAYKRGDDDDFRLSFLRADKNLDSALSDRWALGVTKQYGQNAEHLAQEVREARAPAWGLWQRMADNIVAEMRLVNPSKKPSVREVSQRVHQRLAQESPEHQASVETIRRRIHISG